MSSNAKAVCFTLGLALAGCGPGQVAGVKGPSAEATATPAASVDAPNLVSRKKARVGSEKLVDRRHRTALATDSLDHVKGSAPAPKTSTEIYRAAAPATVVIRVAGGFGSGVIVDKAGWVLTNRHVIAAGKTDDFGYEATVLLGKLGKSGAMERRPKEYKAKIYAADKLRDIALLKLIDPPDDLAVVPIATDKPLPGASVVALGHAGAGMLWALKSGQISALGELSKTLAQLARFKDTVSGRRARKAFQENIERQNLGLVIQSTCNVLPGDSGGPLLNDRGELIGLNVFVRRDPRTGGHLSFHVHLNEIARYAKDWPKHPLQEVPDPWKEGGGDLTYEDANLDGKVDVLLMQGRKPCRFCTRQSSATFIDVDQNSYAGRKVLPELNDVYDKHDFEAEAVYLQVKRDVFVWYDTDDDGRFDTVLYDRGTNGRVDAGYRIEPSGLLRRDAELASTRPFQPSLFKKPEIRDAFARITRVAFPKRYTSATGPITRTLPDPIGRTGRASLGDFNRNGRFDVVEVTSPFSKRLWLDVEEGLGDVFKPSFNVAEANMSKLDAEIAVVSQSTNMWVYYDTDDDGRFDLVLQAPHERAYVAAQAFALAPDGKKTPAPQHLGRKLIRPELLQRAAASAAVKTMIRRGLLEIMSASDDGMASLPDPVTAHRGAGMSLLDLKQGPRMVVAIHGQGSDGFLIDIDRSSGLFGPAKQLKIEKRVRNGKFDAEFAYLNRNGITWAFYDTDARKGYDIILASVRRGSLKADAGYRFDVKTGKLTFDASLVGPPLVRPKLLRRASHQRKLRQLAAELFVEAAVQQ